MKLALELEFPDDQAANVLRLLQNTPNTTARILTHPASVPTSASKSEAELEALFQQLVGSWQSDENGDELNRQLREARQDQPRDIEL
ncbi:hypothetical protein J0X19_06940 [Hymenobacter sp. BT186]|uniref:Uncharacterized protein n=1 Tax=Hymenobacter telluris TaxID=2816474 RepID=A0A939EUW3_9BACT|nr:hypothetical protein [Hymenobacter telluris]MBO0357676.1 hypothetical protein [Hymenobacter telluris]MBW3373703.1 hypothetical protein [Hymenobacter norwichensis]